MKPKTESRLSDFVSVGVLVKVFPPGLVDEVVAETGRKERRVRSLPARVVVYFVVGLALFASESYEEVFVQLTAGLSWSRRWKENWKVPSASALFQARVRLGVEPVRLLFRRVAQPLASLSTPGAWVAGRRLVAIDGTCFDVADTAENAAFFGRPGTAKGEQAAYPQARMVGVVEVGTHAIIDAELGPCTTSEVELSKALLGRLQRGMLCLADRGFYGFNAWQAAAGTGADLLWRMRSTQRLDPFQVLADGSYLSKVYEVSNCKRRGEGVVVRVIEYRIHDGRDNDRTYRLITTILDPAVLSATQCAMTYSERWEIENCLDELKTHQRGPRTVLRSKSPALVEQELWGHLCCHYAVRSFMWEAADHIVEDPDRISFITALRIVRRSMSQAGEGSASLFYRLWAIANEELQELLNPKRRNRSNARVVKRKYTKWHVKRHHHANWPQPTHPPLFTLLPLP